MEYAKPMADAVASVARPLENERDLDAVLEQVSRVCWKRPLHFRLFPCSEDTLGREGGKEGRR